MTLAGLLAIGCAQNSSDCFDVSLVSPSQATETSSFSIEAVRVREASPDQNYQGQPAYVGCSADGFDRTYVKISDLTSLRDKEIVSATLDVKALSGTCASSYDASICDLGMKIDAYVPNFVVPWDTATLTWNTQPPVGLFGENSTVLLPLTSAYVSLASGTPSPNEEATISFEIKKYVTVAANGSENPGLLFQLDFDNDNTRDEQTRLHSGEYRLDRAIQRDLVWQPLQVVVQYR
jgi:hypothetical protein